MKKDEMLREMNDLLKDADTDTVLAVYTTLTKIIKKPETRSLLHAIARRL